MRDWLEDKNHVATAYNYIFLIHCPLPCTDKWYKHPGYCIYHHLLTYHNSCLHNPSLHCNPFLVLTHFLSFPPLHLSLCGHHQTSPLTCHNTSLFLVQCLWLPQFFKPSLLLVYLLVTSQPPVPGKLIWGAEASSTLLLCCIIMISDKITYVKSFFPFHLSPPLTCSALVMKHLNWKSLLNVSTV